MRALRTEGGPTFTLFLVAVFAAAGVAMAWLAASRDAGMLPPALMLLGMAGLLLFLGREELLAALDLRRDGIRIEAVVTDVLLSRAMNGDKTLHRWRVKAEGCLPDGGMRAFLSPDILALSRPDIATGSAVAVDVSPRTGRYRVVLASIAPAEGSRAAAGTAGEGVRPIGRFAGLRRRWLAVAGAIVLTGWALAAALDRRFVGIGWFVVPAVVALFLADVVLATVRYWRSVLRAVRMSGDTIGAQDRSSGRDERQDP